MGFRIYEEGVVSRILPTVKFKGGDGKERSKMPVLVTIDGGKYSREILMDVFGENISGFGLREGIRGRFYYEVSAKEWAGHDRWINNVRMCRFEISGTSGGGGVIAAHGSENSSNASSMTAHQPLPEGRPIDDDLPF